jgi:SH3/ankyrin repeat-containing protein
VESIFGAFQACKNGLVKHVEQLLYYGAEINAQNVNGNTPLHVCAVNGRGDCAQVLLYRGAVATVFNKQGQTPVQVAQVVGNLVVADIILGHNANNIGLLGFKHIVTQTVHGLNRPIEIIF